MKDQHDQQTNDAWACTCTVTKHERMEDPACPVHRPRQQAGRPRKYESAAERVRAYRNRQRSGAAKRRREFQLSVRACVNLEDLQAAMGDASASEVVEAALEALYQRKLGR